ncbi:MAG: 16S rRNA (cytidine(1402)-2'-O)-methyltransferase [Patescibacteria group bacterium]|jgi:16S rRNA (cytidine1402-2'-O)-methyltransferase
MPLYIVATPIGNLEDITLRALRVLQEADLILSEDTRVAQKLLQHYEIKVPLLSFHHHSGITKVNHIIELIKEDKKIALISDAGTPGISDPGGELVHQVLEAIPDIQIEAIPGPSALIAALSISGMPTDKFLFLGFPPHKKGRQTFLGKIKASEYPVVVYESKHRIIKFLEELKVIIDPLSEIMIGRELTKMHETAYRGTVEKILAEIKSDSNAQRGEFVVIIKNKK